MRRCILPTCLLLCLGALPGRAVEFTYHDIDTGVGYVRVVADVSGDGFPDIVATDGGGLVWFEYPSWRSHVLADEAFDWAGDDIEACDADGDGDLDIVGSSARGGAGEVVLLVNPLPAGDPAAPWITRTIGDAGQVAGDAYVKDLAVTDLDGDGRPDVAARVHRYTYLFLQEDGGAWREAKRLGEHPPEEGLAAADLDGDGDPDLVLNGFWLRNPRPGPLDGAWSYFEIDEAYHDEGGSWPSSAAKVAVADMDGDGRLDVLLSDSEQDPADYPDEADPVAWFEAADPTGPWTRHVIDARLGEAHTLHAADIDLDGDLDVVTGQMSDKGEAPVRVYYNQGGASDWTYETISNDGIYSGVLGDIGRDGDLDLVGVQDWNDLVLGLFENALRDGTTDVPQGPPAAAPVLGPAAPNPFNPRTVLRFALPVGGAVRLTVHDARGALVRVLIDRSLPAGEHAAAWDGRSGRGSRVPSGVYLLRLDAPGGVQTRKIVLAG